MSTESFLSKIERRNFLRILAITGVSGLIYPSNLISSILSKDLSRVVIIEHSEATSGSTIYPDTVQLMMDTAIKGLAQINDLGEAWKSLLPEINANQKVAIKVNCINSSLSSHPEVAYAIAEGLKQMSFVAGFFTENNIIIFDRTNYELQSAGYTINTSENGVRCFGTNNSGVGYSTDYYSVNGSNQKISTIITEIADYIINLGVLKNHSISGATLCLKNHYGTCHNPGQLHSNQCDPSIPALNALPVIYDKQSVNIIDALYGIYSGGPGGSPQFIANKFILSQDIVAADYWGRELLVENGCNTTYNAHHIDTAAQNPYNLGTNDPEEMEVLNILNPVTGVESNNVSGGFQLKQNFPNPFQNNTQIDFYIPRKLDVQLSIYSNDGQKVREIFNSTMPLGWHNAFWDGKNDIGHKLKSGLYIGQLKSSGYNKSIIMQLMN